MVSTIVTEDCGPVGIVRLANGVTNAIGPQMVADLETALAEATKSFGGIVLAGGDKFFSMGFDLPELMELARDEVADFFEAFNRVTLRVFTLSMPTCCAIRGHAVAGGHILALSCDHRLAAPRAKLGLNEIHLGVPVPYLADLMLRLQAGDRTATELMFSGRFLTAADGQPLGLVDAVPAKAEIEDQAVEKVSELTELPRAAFAAIKSARVEAVARRYQRHRREKNEYFLDCWFSETGQRLLRRAARKF